MYSSTGKTWLSRFGLWLYRLSLAFKRFLLLRYYYVKWIDKTIKVRSYTHLSVKEKDSKCILILYHIHRWIWKSQPWKLCSIKNFYSWIKNFQLLFKSCNGHWIFNNKSHICWVIINGTWVLKWNMCITTCIPDLMTTQN